MNNSCRRRLALLCAVLLLSCFVPTPAKAAHPLRLTDYSDRSRIGLEIAFGKMKSPTPADFVHYLLEIDANIYHGTHLLLGIPFSGYSGVDGDDNFIRGNILVGGAYRLALAEWLSLGFALKLYLPTYERAGSVDFGFDQDPRRAILSHWHYRFQYALEDNFPMSPELAAKFDYAGFFFQLEGGATWAPLVRRRPELIRKNPVVFLHWGAGLGYDILGYLELNATVTGLFDPDAEADNTGDLLAMKYKRPISMHVATVGPRAQYKYFAARFEANFPLEPRFREILQPYYSLTLQVQFP